FKKAGIDCRVGVKVKGAKKARDGVSVDTERGEVWARQLRVAGGRARRWKDVGLEQVGVTTHQNGCIRWTNGWARRLKPTPSSARTSSARAPPSSSPSPRSRSCSRATRGSSDGTSIHTRP